MQTIDLIKDSTAQRMAYALEAIAHKKLTEGVVDYDMLATIAASGNADKFLHIGEAINTEYTTESGEKLIYPAFVTDFEPATLENGEVCPSIGFQFAYATVEEVPFDSYEAFYVARNQELPAGTYHMKMGYAWSKVQEGDTWSFTLTKPLPIGGVIGGFRNAADVSDLTGTEIKTYDKAGGKLIETATVRKGAEGTLLGTFTAYGDGTINGLQRTAYGSNRYKESFQRQWLNNKGKDYFKAQNEYDLPPDTIARGFMSGFEPNFLSILRPVKVTVANNTVEGLPASEDVFDTFYLPSLEEMNITAQAPGVEGPVTPYWKAATGIEGSVPWYTPTPELVHLGLKDKIGKYVRLRSAYRYNACNAWLVYPSGYVSGNLARSAFACAPRFRVTGIPKK